MKRVPAILLGLVLILGVSEAIGDYTRTWTRTYNGGRAAAEARVRNDRAQARTATHAPRGGYAEAYAEACNRYGNCAVSHSTSGTPPRKPVKEIFYPAIGPFRKQAALQAADRYKRAGYKVYLVRGPHRWSY